MKRSILMLMILALPVAFTACTDGFPDEEMHLGLENKVRPLGIYLNTPDASPGQMVTVRLVLFAPDPDALDITWQVALDFNRGLYGTDEVEGHVLPLENTTNVEYGDGLMVQTLSWVVPDSVARISSALPEVLTDPVLVALAQAIIGPEAGEPPTREGVENWLIQRAGGGPLTDEEEALVDRFSCAVRFRATIVSDEGVVDVTRNLTVRYSNRLHSWGENTNNLIETREIFALEKENATWADRLEPGITVHTYDLLMGYFGSFREIPYHPDWTYFLDDDILVQAYRAPYEPDLLISEELTNFRYYLRQDEPTSTEAFFLNEDGEPAEMWELADEVRLQPAGAGSEYTIVSVVRDWRRDWVSYHLAPGLSLYTSQVRFVEP